MNVHSSSTWQSYFAKEFDKREYDKQNPLYNIVADQEQELVDFFTLSLETKIHLIHLLCEVNTLFKKMKKRILIIITYFSGNWMILKGLGNIWRVKKDQYNG